MRTKEEIQNVHDILHSAITTIMDNKIPGVLDGHHMLAAHAALDALCFAMKHGTSESFIENIQTLHASMTALGYGLTPVQKQTPATPPCEPWPDAATTCAEPQPILNQQELIALAAAIEKLLPKGTGYLFLSFPTSRPGYGSNYTNVTRQQSINAARQYANAVEDGTDMPTPNGN